MRHRTSVLLLVALALASLPVLGCSDANETDSGGVSLVLSDFDELPIAASVNTLAANGSVLQVGELTLQSIIQNPNAEVTNLQTIELSTLEVTYRRADTGTRVPDTLVQRILGSVPPGGTTTIENQPILFSQQLLNPPLSDLLFVNGALDRETGSDVILLDVQLRFFGETLGGREVVSNPQSFTIEFVP